MAALLAGCSPAVYAPPPPQLVATAVTADLGSGEDEVSLVVVELMCRPCAARIVEGSRELPGVTSVRMVLATKTLTVRFATSITARDRIVEQVEDLVARTQ